jgi:hypothetical protein
MDETAKRLRAVWEKAVLHNLSEVEEEQALTNREFTLHIIRMQDSLGSQEKLDINQVLKLYEEAISVDPRNILAYYDLARNYLVENSLDRAESITVSLETKQKASRNGHFKRRLGKLSV